MQAPGHGTRRIGVQRTGAVGPADAVSGGVQIHQFRVDRGKRGVVNLQAFGHPWPEAEREDVGLLDERIEDLSALVCRHVDGDALLARHRPHAAALLHPEGAAHRVAGEALDLDDARTQGGGQGDTEGHGEEVAEFDDGHPGERMGRGGSGCGRGRPGAGERAVVDAERGGGAVNP